MNESVALGEVLLGKYRVERLLGSGGMGVVVAVRHVDLGQLHAMKLLLPTALENQEAHERFLREARAAARLTSDHVVRVQDVGYLENGQPYMIMEYLEGCDLKEFLSKQGRLSPAESVTYVLQVCEAMVEAHAAGIVHRDLKPANLFLVRRRFSRQSIKVLDFGISKQTGPNHLNLTDEHAVLGSPLYMAPEQMGRVKTVDGRTDIWALGVILYELLTGASPFEGDSMLEVASQVLQEEPTPLRDLRPELPEDLEQVVNKCLRKRAAERFQTVQELHAALAKFGRSELPIQQTAEVAIHKEALSRVPATIIEEATSRPFGRANRPTPAKKRSMNAWVLVPLAVGVGIVVGGTTFTLTSWREEPDSMRGVPISTSGTSTIVVPDAVVPPIENKKLEMFTVPQVPPYPSGVIVEPAPTTVKIRSVPAPPSPPKIPTNSRKRYTVH